MIRTLDAFLRSEYPNHAIRGDGAHELTAHTALADFTTTSPTSDVADRLRERFGAAHVSVVSAVPPSPSVVRDRREQDPNSVAEVPKRRPMVGALALGIALLVVMAVIAAIAGASIWVVVVLAAFAAMLGVIEGAIIFGGARFAGERAWLQENTPDETVQFVAVFTAHEREAVEAAKTLSAAGAARVRVVSGEGAWHLPNLYTATE